MTKASQTVGGRLPLADPATLTGAQRELYETLKAKWAPYANEAGVQVTTADGSLIGPFGREGMLTEPPAPFWVAQLPHHRDETVARDYTRNIHSNWRRRTRETMWIAATWR